jgi:hypothetical protein
MGLPAIVVALPTPYVTRLDKLSWRVIIDREAV